MRQPLVKPLTLFLGLLIISLVINLGAAYVIRANFKPELLEADEFEYYDLAGQVIDGRYEFHPRRVVGHVPALAVLRVALGNHIFPIQLAISAIFSLTAPLTYLLARRELGSCRAALLAGLVVTTWPLFVRYGATLYSETLALPLFVAFLLAIPSRYDMGYRCIGRWLGAGALLGLCMHVRPMYLLYSPLAALVAYWRGPGGCSGMARITHLVSGCLVVVLPWSIFMSLREGSPVLFSTNGGETIAGGLNPELLRIEREDPARSYMTPNGRVTWVGPGKWLGISQTGYLSAQEEKLPYTKQSELLFKRAVAWAIAHPRLAVYLSISKIAYMWGIYPLWNGWSQTILGNVPLLGLSALAIATLVKSRHYLRELAIFWTLPIFVSLVALISWGSWRFRQPGDVGLIVLAAALPFVSEVKQALGNRALRRVTGILG